jgi:hypothetical protein
MFTCPSSPAMATVQSCRRRGRGSAPERAGERVAAVEAADRSGIAPESAGSKRAAPEQSLSGRPAKKHRVRSKM